MQALSTLLAASIVAVSGCAQAAMGPDPVAVQPPANTARPLSGADAQGLAEFNERVTAYAALHEKLEATLPALPTETTPENIHKHQNALAQLMSRRGKAPGRETSSPPRRRSCSGRSWRGSSKAPKDAS